MDGRVDIPSFLRSPDGRMAGRNVFNAIVEEVVVRIEKVASGKVPSSKKTGYIIRTRRR